MISRSTDIKAALRSKQRGLILNPFRFVTPGGGDPHWANVSLLLLYPGADASTSFTDAGPIAHTVTPSGGAQVDTAFAHFGTGSLLLDGVNSYLTVNSHASLDLGSGSYTIELFWRPNSVSANQMLASYILPGAVSGANVGWNMHYAGAGTDLVDCNFFTGGTLTNVLSPSTIVPGQFNHVAFLRNGTNVRVAMNGTLGTPVTTANAINAPASRVLFVGRYINADTRYANGWNGAMRITKGVCRWTTNFIPPTSFPIGP